MPKRTGKNPEIIMKTLSEIKSILHAHADKLRKRNGIVNLAVYCFISEVSL
jgi:hypothetical protein